MIDIEELLNTAYLTEFPDLLSDYHIDIEHQSLDGLVWSGKLWKEQEDGRTYPFMAVANTGEGGCNKYIRITSPEDEREFFAVARKCFPKQIEPQDYACVYLELRQAKQDLDNE